MNSAATMLHPPPTSPTAARAAGSCPSREPAALLRVTPSRSSSSPSTPALCCASASNPSSPNAPAPAGTTAEVLVVDNASTDGSPEMVEREFVAPHSPVRLMRSEVNLGFAAANNLAMEAARGRYLVLLNSDAFFHPGALRLAIQHMDANTTVGVGGARLVGPQGEWQPSARAFPTLWHVFVVFSGLASRYPRSRIFGAFDRTWASPDLQAEVDWVPGAFSIMRREALAENRPLRSALLSLLRRSRSLPPHQGQGLSRPLLARRRGHSHRRRIQPPADHSQILRQRIPGRLVAHESHAALLPQASRHPRLGHPRS
jgi:cellulose synthase/poly-beta-1,6-N-acetylglucosamine synthase-like glycosyltransferase